ncbi:MAG: glycosyltransferase family 9 protein [Lentisphaerae bacterium]|nr:glycosyltransferase family 9 protein [Lentisphaerota bacterium]MCP4103720.1 glycosyltransferase family 9 protein [Lentisphaerota bacterium]
MNILLTRLQNIGDMMAFIPALRLLRESFPDAKITMLCKHAGGVELIKNCPYYDDIIIVNNRSLKEKLRLIKEFRKRRLDYFIISPQDQGRVPWALMGGAKKIIAYKSVEFCGKDKKEKLPFFISIDPDFNPERTETENCINLIKACIEDAKCKLPDKIDMSLEYSWIKDESQNSANQLLRCSSVKSGKYVVVAPFSAKCDSRNWEMKNWTEIVHWINNELDCDVAIIGGEQESLLAKKLISQVGGNYLKDFCGKSSLDESFAVLKQAKGFIGLDSGPAFMATAAPIPAVVLYGSGDIERWTPPETRAPRINIYHKQDCAPCRYKVCPNESKCMKAISVQEVKAAFEKVIA